MHAFNDGSQSDPQHRAADEEQDILVPRQRVEELQKVLGIDVLQNSDRPVAEQITAQFSISASPYLSPDMISAYRKQGMADVARRAVDTVDEERRWRHARMEQDQNHQHRLELEESARLTAFQNEELRQKRAGQKYAFILGAGSIIVSTVGSKFGVPSYLCYVIVVTGIGGPSAATALSRLIPGSSK